MMLKSVFILSDKYYKKVYSFLAGTPPRTNLLHFQHIVATSLNKFVRNSLKNFDTTAKWKVLDVGCGSLPYRRFAGNDWEWVGLDTDGNLLADIKVSMSDKRWKIPSESFDIILCTEVLEHVLYPESMLREIHRTLKTNGTLILTTPFVYPIHGAPNDFRRFTPDFYQKNLEGFQFEVLKLSGGFGSSIATLILNWIEFQCQKSYFYSIVRAISLPFWLISSAILNSMAVLLDRVDISDSLGTNVVLLATKN